MSTEIHYKTFEDHYYESERLNMEARKEITQLKDVILDLSEALQELKGGLPVSCNIDREITTKTLSKHQELLNQLNKEIKGE